MLKIRFFLNLFLICLLISLIFTLISYLNSRSERRNFDIETLIVDNFVRFYLWGCFAPLIFKLNQFLEAQTKLRTIPIVIIHILAGVIVSALHNILFAVFLSSFSLLFRERHPDIWVYVQNSFLGSLYLGLMIYAIIVLASQTYLRNQKFAEEEKKAAMLQSQLVQSQLQALKMQLQPHFLFNTLNSISSLVLKNPPQAQTMIAKLGDFLRQTLDFKENQMVSLREELSFLRSYLDIEQTRFSEKLQVIFNVNDNVMNAVVPHLALQPIVENSVKHGISQMTEGGKIEIIAQQFEDKLQLQVIDNGQAKTASSETNQTGLANIKARLRHLYGDQFKFEMSNNNSRGMTVTITIPLSFDFAESEKNDE